MIEQRLQGKGLTGERGISKVEIGQGNRTNWFKKEVGPVHREEKFTGQSHCMNGDCKYYEAGLGQQVG